MKKKLVFFIFLLGTFSAFSQKIQYSRGTFQNFDPDNTQLVSNINGYHHLLTFTLNKKPTIQVFNPQLQLNKKKQIGFSVTNSIDIKTLSLFSHYFLYTHTPQSSRHDIWKIDREGNAVSFSGKFQKSVDSVFGRYMATFQLINKDGGMYVLGHTYFDTLKTIVSTAIEFNSNLDLIAVRKVAHPFNRETDFFQQATISAGDLYILRTSRNFETGNSLEIVKVNLATGKLLANSFFSGWHIYVNPGFVLSNKDSSILLYAQLRNSSLRAPQERTVFITKLSPDLQEKIPVSVLRSQFRQNIIANFLFLQGQQPLWLNMYSGMRIQRAATHNYWLDTLGSVNFRRPSFGYVDRNAYGQSAGIRFTLLDESLRHQKDSIISNDKNLVEVQPFPFSQFIMKNKGQLVLIRNFSPRRKGLIILSPDERNHFSFNNVPVYDRYDYLLPQLQYVENYFIVPYMTKNEMGLLKVTMDER